MRWLTLNARLIDSSGARHRFGFSFGADRYGWLYSNRLRFIGYGSALFGVGYASNSSSHQIRAPYHRHHRTWIRRWGSALTPVPKATFPPDCRQSPPFLPAINTRGVLVFGKPGKLSGGGQSVRR